MARIKRRKTLGIPMAPHPNAIRRVVCSAIRFGDIMLTGCRHWDVTMRNQVRNLSRVALKKINLEEEEQGFLDQWGNFMSREEAFQVAILSGQITREDMGCREGLFSEDVW